MEYIIGNSSINSEELEIQANQIIELLKNKKQTYAVNKFVLEKTIENLKETII